MNLEDFEPHIQRRIVKNFVRGWRGRFIITKALYMEIREMESDPDVFENDSDLKDMRFLREQWFDFPDATFQRNPFLEGSA